MSEPTTLFVGLDVHKESIAVALHRDRRSCGILERRFPSRRVDPRRCRQTTERRGSVSHACLNGGPAMDSQEAT